MPYLEKELKCSINFIRKKKSKISLSNGNSVTNSLNNITHFKRVNSVNPLYVAKIVTFNIL